MRVVDWYLGLGRGQMTVVGIAVAVGVLLATYFATLVILASSEPGAEATPPAAAPVPASSQAGGTQTSSSASAAPNFAMEIDGARWAGGEAVVEGTWRGDLSSVHCDLLEGGISGRAIDWWDRSVAAEASYSEKTFSQEFVRADGRVKDRIDPEGDYWAVCWAQFSDGGAAGDETAVDGEPPG